MTPAQMSTLKAAILANPTQAANVAIQDYSAIADWLNAASAFIVWRSSIPVGEYRDAITWTEVDALTTGSKYRIWEWLTGNMTLPLESGKAAVRAGLADCWAANSTTRASLLAVGKRAATNAEWKLATGTGTTATPGSLTWEGQINAYDIGGILSAA